jgi:transcriptional regulator with XRE-family HTH domain
MIEEAEIGKRIRQIRKKHGYTLRTLAKKTNFSQGFLSKVENSRKAPSIGTLMKLAKTLDVRMADFFGETQADTMVTLVKASERREMAREGILTSSGILPAESPNLFSSTRGRRCSMCWRGRQNSFTATRSSSWRKATVSTSIQPYPIMELPRATRNSNACSSFTPQSMLNEHSLFHTREKQGRFRCRRSPL